MRNESRIPTFYCFVAYELLVLIEMQNKAGNKNFGATSKKDIKLD